METKATNETVAPSTSEARLELPISGMSCAACAARIEKQLRGVPGVHAANVNFATNRATVEYDPAACDAGALAETVERAGYGVRSVETSLPEDVEREEREQEYRELRLKFWVAAALALPVLVISMTGIALPGRDWLLMA